MGGKGSGRRPGFSQYNHAPTLPPEAPNPSRLVNGDTVRTEEAPSLIRENQTAPRARSSRAIGLLKDVADEEKVREHIATLQARSAERAAYWAEQIEKNVTERPYDHKWMNTFLAALRNSGNVRAACDKAGISKAAAYLARDRDSIFRDAWEEAQSDAVDILEAVAWSRAQTQSDTLLIFLLKHNRPEKYLVPKQVEHSGPGGGAIPLSLIDSVIAQHDPAITTIDAEYETTETTESPE